MEDPDTMTTTTNLLPATRERVQALAAFYGSEAARLMAESEAAYQRMNEHRNAMYAADREREDRAAESAAIRANVANLARALAWRGVGVIEETEPAYGLERVQLRLRAAFATGRAWVGSHDRRAPRGHAVGWPTITPGHVAIYEGPGTNDPAKQAAQRAEAESRLRAWLDDYTAEAWLRREGLDPANAPELAAVAGMSVDVHARGYGDARYWAPRWTLTLGGADVGSIDWIADILDPANGLNGADRYQQAKEKYGEPPADEEGARAWAVAIAPDARDALIRRLGPSSR